MKIIDDCEVCQPMDNFLKYLEDEGFKIIEGRLSDYHFKEFYFKVSGIEKDIPNFKKINKISNTKFLCSCHWSTVEIVYNDDAKSQTKK